MSTRKAQRLLDYIPNDGQTLAGHDTEGNHFDIRPDRDSWYITVKHPNGSNLYNGWWTQGYGKSLTDAVAEAIKGAGL